MHVPNIPLQILGEYPRIMIVTTQCHSVLRSSYPPPQENLPWPWYWRWRPGMLESQSQWSEPRLLPSRDNELLPYYFCSVRLPQRVQKPISPICSIPVNFGRHTYKRLPSTTRSSSSGVKYLPFSIHSAAQNLCFHLLPSG